MNKIYIVPNESISAIRLQNIINLKRQHWSYPDESQMAWIKANINTNDLHLFVEKSGQILAYLDIVKLKIATEKDVFDALGIGNVCVDKNSQHQGFGRVAVCAAGEYIVRNKNLGVLLCHEVLIDFYMKCGWTVVSRKSDVLEIAGNRCEHSFMVYNGKGFESINDAKWIHIDRNF